MPISISNAVNAGSSSGPAEGVIVLRSAVDFVKRRVGLFTSHVVKLRYWKIGNVPPVSCRIETLVYAAIATGQIVIRMFRINPQRVEIDVRPSSAKPAKRFASV